MWYKASHICRRTEENLHMKYDLVFETVYHHNIDSSTSQNYNPHGKMSNSTRPAVTLISLW
jgi:hypothetical protein